MKKFIAFIAIIGLAFSACNGKYTIAKRKYNKGFYVSKNTDNTTKPVAANKTVRTVQPVEKIETVVVAKTNVEETKIEIAPVRAFVEPAAENTVSNGDRASNSSVVASTSKTNYTPSVEVKPIKINSASTQSAKKGESGGKLILMIILCFFPFINLIAIYMHDGGITTNFWVTLLLDFLFFLPGIIFSLLVVLDVVDLG